jgi:hypothetical protein
VSLRTARILTALYFAGMLFCVTWPGMTLFSQVYPLVLGLPFSLAWIAGWIAGSVLVLSLLDRVEKRARDADAAPAPPPPQDGHRGPAGGHRRGGV